MRGAEGSGVGNDEISVALLRVREIRLKDESHARAEEVNYVGSGMTIWETMKRGVAVIDK